MGQRKAVPFRAVKEAAVGRWAEIIGSVVGGDLDEAIQAGPHKHVECPVHGGKNRDGLRIFPDFHATGGVICNTCGARNDGFNTIKWLLNTSDDREVLVAVQEYLNVHPKPQMRRVTKAKRNTTPRRKWTLDPGYQSMLKRNWERGIRLDKPQARRAHAYLQSRGFQFPLDSSVSKVLRFDPSQLYFYRDENDNLIKEKYPALLCLYQRHDGRASQIQRIYLSAEGSGKAPVSDPKKLMKSSANAPVAGSAIRLFAPGRVMGVTEGVETALAVYAMTGMPVWASGTANLLEAMAIPPWVEHLFIWADRDRSRRGWEAARNLMLTLTERTNLTVYIVYPPIRIPPGAKGVDWLDFWAAGYREPIKRVAGQWPRHVLVKQMPGKPLQQLYDEKRRSA